MRLRGEVGDAGAALDIAFEAGRTPAVSRDVVDHGAGPGRQRPVVMQDEVPFGRLSRSDCCA